MTAYLSTVQTLPFHRFHMSLKLYPPPPLNTDARVIEPSLEFRKQVGKVLAAIAGFMVVYLVLVGLAVSLAVLCGLAGVLLVVALPKFITLMIGIGLAGLGLMVLIFLFKFIFKKNKTDRSHLIEVKQSDQPELFAFIKRLTQETQSEFPKRIYISPEVNACVFYDSSFWSMFLPVRKNLQIGLGLVNSVNVSEFKAVLAHEFGHFSQRSMKLGSYVYNVNQVIYNMLYDNEGYSNTLQGWANISGYFAFFAGLTGKIIQGIQWILQQVYGFVNKQYLSLSRQMEFHADSVAAYVSGGNHLVTSLRRLEVADMCYNKLFEHYNEWFRLNLKADNIYPQHVEIMRHYAEDHGLVHIDGIPQVTNESFTHSIKSRLIIKNQWASHPSTDDREAHLNKLGLHTEPVSMPAWVLFNNPEGLQRTVTDKIYASASFKETPGQLDIHEFRQRYHAEARKYSLDHRYKNFFSNRFITSYDVDVLLNELSSAPSSLIEVINPDTVSLCQSIAGLTSDIEGLQAIMQGNIPVKSFEFDGTKYTDEDCDSLVTRLKAELGEAEKSLKDADKSIILYFFRLAADRNHLPRIKQTYKDMFSADQETEENVRNIQEIRRIIQPAFEGNVPFDVARSITQRVISTEVTVKDTISRMLLNENYTRFLNGEELDKMKRYSTSNHKYFVEPSFIEDEIILMSESLGLFQYISSERSFAIKKELLDWQLTLIETE